MGRPAIGGWLRNCEHCGAEFKRWPGQLKRRFCSNRCGILARGLKLRRTEPRPCDCCGGPTLNDHYCSNACKLKHINTARKQRNRASGLFPSNIEIKRLLLIDFGRCEDCGWKEEPAALELHHMDRNTKNRRRENVKLLCPNCHTIRHYREGTGQFAIHVGRRR